MKWNERYDGCSGLRGDTDRPVVLREVQVESAKHVGIGNEISPENSPWKAVEVSFVSQDNPPPIIMKEEQFTGNGNDDVWKNPDSVWMPDINANLEDDVSSKDTTVKAVQTELERAWSTVVGDPVADAMDESRLGQLCAELGLGHFTRSEDISELFAALDSDNDGFVTFQEFSEQMSDFLSCDQGDITETGNGQQHSAIGDADTETMNTSQHRKIPTPDFADLKNDEVYFNDEDSDGIEITSRPQTPVDVVDVCESAMGSRNVRIPPSIKEVTSSPAPSMTLSEGSRTPDSRGHLSIDSDTSPLCPPVVSVEPRQLAATSRARRRRRSSAVAASNPASARQQRRKSSRSIPLPHYHPASIRRVEELPLSYLTEENERYVSPDTLRRNWELEGLEDSSSVLEELQLTSTDQSVSVEALSEVLEMEFDHSLLQKAALLLYKRGINHYRALYDNERVERSKHESKIQHLVSQLQEQEERLERAESNFRQRAEQIETKYKMEVRALTDELNSAQTRIKEQEQETMTNRDEELRELNEKYEKSEAFLDDLRNENEKLAEEKEDAESRLMDAEEAVTKMQEDLDIACRGIALSNRQLASQRKQYVDLLRLYEEQTQSLQDSNDELFDRLQQSRRRWSSPSRSKSQSTRRKTSSMLRNSDTSSYSSASEESHHSSTCQSFVDDSPKTLIPEGQFMTSSPAGEAPENRKIVTSNTFAFLTPSTTHAKSRVHTFASLAIAPPPLSPESRSNV